MNLTQLVNQAIDKTRFTTIDKYIDFCKFYLEYIDINIQARIVSQNENKYQFIQYNEEGNFNITRPINSELMYGTVEFDNATLILKDTLRMLANGEQPPESNRKFLINSIYTIQQSIGAMLDALPAGKSNQARKVNGDLFERFIQLLINALNIECVAGVVKVPVKDNKGEILFSSNYQHDLMISKDGELKAIGSVKTSSKDRIDKVFIDKFLYNRLTDTALPHIAIFLNDVQRKKTNKENVYGISGTFLSGHFKAYTIKLNPLDGVYYCDIRPNMISDPLISQYIKTIDHFFYSDLWNFLEVKGNDLDEVEIIEEE
ncbi:hypothetical protein ACIWI6_10540 [Acinetobacter baumannii]